MATRILFSREDILRLAVAMYGQAEWYRGKAVRPITGRPMTYGSKGWSHAAFDPGNSDRDHVAILEWLLSRGVTVQFTATALYASCGEFVKLVHLNSLQKSKAALFRMALHYLDSSEYTAKSSL